MPATDRCIIRIDQLQRACLSACGRLVFKAEVKVIQLDERSAIPSFPISITDPWEFEEYDQYRRHLTQQDPHRKDVTDSALDPQSLGLKLFEYAHNLLEQLSLPDDVLNHSCLEINVCGSSYHAPEGRSLDYLLWETLEQAFPHDEKSTTTNPLPCIVIRSLPTRSPKPLPTTTVQNAVHVLLLIARRAGEDAPLSLVLWELQRIQYELYQDPSSRCHLDVQVVRPATYNGLQKHLETRGYGFFDILHIDSHGGIEKHTTPVIYLQHDEHTSDPRPAQQLGKLLQQYGVRTVSLNSCDSTNASYGSDANLAEVFRSFGISSVIGMSAKISTTAVAYWSYSFFRHLIAGGRTFAEAAALSRMELYHQPRRRAREEEGKTLTIWDWPVPTTYADGQEWRSQTNAQGQARAFHPQICHPSRLSKPFAKIPSFATGYSILWRDPSGSIYTDGRLDDNYQSLVYDESTQELENFVTNAENNIVYLYGPATAELVDYSTYLIRLWLGTQFINYAFIIDCKYFAANWALHMGDHIRHLFLRDSICHLHKRLATRPSPQDQASPGMVIMFQNVNAIFPLEQSNGGIKTDAQARFHTLLRKILDSCSTTAGQVHAAHVIVQGEYGVSWLSSQDGPLGEAMPYQRDEPGDICSLLSGPK